ncbi:hypothetical protein QAD02_012480 [Eretmocerus hayati]|uniref:Uncharacterized protein n=1 Tax=Eretmocerus hayati TaxID=131215 RepID=A0ACC2P0P0_9HYME|nr:hypothetical protein QAD02_012480 [Eretmocerus hayati]
MEEDWDNDVGLPPPASQQAPYVPPQYDDRNHNNNFKMPQESRFDQDRRRNTNRNGGDGRRGGRDSSRGSSTSRGEQFTFYVETCLIGKLIGKGGSKIRELQEQSGARININKDCTSGDNTLVVISGPQDAQQRAKDMIDSLLSDNTMHRRPNHSLERNNQTSHAPMEIDWDQAAKEYDSFQKEKWSQYPDIRKNFYVEDPAVANLSPEEVEHIRKENNEISVQLTFVSDKAHEAAEGKMIPNPIQNFEQAFKNYPDVLTEIRKQGFTKPSPIQCQAWPILLSGKDMIGIAQTGTGKTLAFLLPALIHIDNQATPRNERSGPTVLVMAPTRELALQIEKEVNKYYYHGIKAVCVYGGGSMKEQINTVSKGVEIVIATPGRLNDLVQKGILDVKCVSYLVLDEADRMLDMGFEPQIRKTLLDVRPDRQTVMTSATWPPGVRRLAQSYMKDPLTVCVGSLDLKAVHSVTQRIYIIDEEEKVDMVSMCSILTFPVTLRNTFTESDVLEELVALVRVSAS